MKSPDTKKSVQIINFFAQESGGTIDYLRMVKLVFLTDKFMMCRYARMLSDDQYFAMQHGPVPSTIKDIANEVLSAGKKSSSLDSPVSEKYCFEYLKPSKSIMWGIESKGKFDSNLFSQADVYSMRAIIKKFGEYSGTRLRKITHDFYEWKRHKIDGKDPNKKRALMNLTDFFSNIEDPSLRAFFAFDPEDLKVKRNYFLLKNGIEIHNECGRA